MKIKDYVYSLVNGIGIIESIDGDDINVNYGDFNENESSSDLSLISNDAISFIRTGKWTDYLPFNSVERGEDVFYSGKVKSIVLMGSNLTGSVEGSHGEIYNTTSSFSKSNIRSTCTCPVGKNCKHAAAILYYAEERIKKLSNNTNDIESGDDLFLSLAYNIKSKISTKDSLNAIDEFAKYLSNNTFADYELENYLVTLENNILDNAILTRIIEIIYFNANTRNHIGYYNPKIPRISRILNNFGNQISLFKIIDKEEYVYRCNNLEYYVIAFLANQLYNQLLILCVRSYRDYSLYLSFCADKLIIDKEFIDAFNRLNKAIYDNVDDVARNIFDMADSSVKEYLCKTYNGAFLSLVDLENIPTSSIIEYINVIEPFKDRLKIINEKYYELLFSVDTKKLAKEIVMNFYEGNAADKKSLLKKVYETNTALYALISYFARDYSREYTLNINEFLETFDVSYKINTIDDETDISINFIISIDQFSLGTIEVDNSGNYKSGYTEFGVDSNYKIAKLLFNYYSSVSEFNQELDSLNEAIRIKRFEKKKKEYLDAIRGLSNDDLAIKLDTKVHLEYEFSYETDYNDRDYYSLRMKVGNKKTYYIKDPYSFLNAVEKKKTIKYGKELEFNHRIDNFKDVDKDVIEYFLTLPYDVLITGYGSQKYIKLYPKAFERVINILKGEYISFDSKLYHLTLEEKEINIKVDNDYHLVSDINKYSVLELDKVYLIDEELKEINIAKATDDEIQLIKFTNNNPNMDLSLVKTEFVDEVYAKYHDLIEIPENLKSDFKLSELKIDAYFDYVNSNIILETKVYKDDVLLTTDAFMTSLDKARYNAYKNYIDSIGFIDQHELIDNSLILQFFTMDLSDLRKLCNVYLSDKIKSKQVENLTPPTIRIQYNNSMMEVFLEDSRYDEEELYTIMKAIRQKKNFVLLKDDRIITFDDKSNDFYDTVTDLNLDIKSLSGKKRIETYDALKALAHENNIKIDDYIKKMIQDIKTFKEQDIEIPTMSEDTILRNYQKEGFKWLSILSKYHMGGILADDMGLGKTLEFITLFKSDNKEMPSLIVCPKSLVFNWYSEFEKFDGITDVRMIYGSISNRHNLINGINPKKKVIYIISYDSLRNDLDLFINYEFNYLILDEAQAIKNVNAQKSNSVKQINAIHRFALTGTPIENNVIDLWSIFDFIMPGYMQELAIFKAKYLKSDNYSNIISKKTAPFILRRTKQEVLKDLPPKFERIISCDMTNSQRKIYEAHIKDAKDKLKDGMNMEILAYLTRLRQICIEPRLFIDEYIGGSGKINYLKELLPEYINNGHRILIFSAFTQALGLVAELLNELKIKYYILTGDTKMEDRKRDTDEFNANDDIKVYLISLKAGGTGLNLIGADTVIHLDPWWNVSAENQASDRAYRIGQVRNVEVMKLVASESIEERVIELQNIKKGVIDKIIAKDDTKITGISLDDLKFILG